MQFDLAKVFILCSLVVISVPIKGQQLSAAEINHLIDQTIALDVSNNFENTNWEPVASALAGKQLISLGEFNHGSREVFVARNQLIKYLHKHEGIDLILFESGIGEVGVINERRSEFREGALTSGFFAGWRTQEFTDLMSFAVSEGIQVAGFDVQRTGNTFTKYMAGNHELSDSFDELESEFVSIKGKLSNYRTIFDSIQAETKSLTLRYQKLLQEMPESARLARYTLENRITFLDYMSDFGRTKNWSARWKARDSVMARNIQWHLNTYKPQRKVIIIAHNFHIAKYNEKETVMGEYLSKEWENDLYVMGVFASQGSYLNNRGVEEVMTAPSEEGLDIKHIIDADNAALVFYNIPEVPEEENAWLSEEIIVNDTFIDLSNSNKLNLSKSFDGLLLFDRVGLPQVLGGN